MSGNLERLLARLYPLLSVLSVVGITFRLYWYFAKATDLVLADEASYLTAGRLFLEKGVLPAFQYSPLYAIWYSAHLALCRDAVVAYYAQTYVTTLLTAVGLYWYLRLVEVPRPLAILGTVLWVAQPAYILPGWPRPYHFAILIFLTGAIVLRKLKAESGVPLALGGASFLLLTLAVRGEYLTSLVFFLCMALIMARSQALLPAPQRGSSYWWPAGLFVGAASLHVWLHLKAAPAPSIGGASRTWLAFGQHFSFYQLASFTGSGKLDPWNDWELIVGRVFPRAHSILAAALTNPRAFGRFELHNIIALPETILGCFRNPYGLIKVLMVCLTFVWMSFTSLTSASLRRRALLRTATALGPYVLSATAAVFPVTLISSELTNYLLPLLFVLYLGALKWLSVVLEEESALHKSLVGISAVMLSLMFLILPSPFDLGRNPAKPVYLEMTGIRAILNAEKIQEVRILQIGGTGYSAFLPYSACETVDASDRRENERFWDFVDRAHVDAVLVDDRLRLSRLYRDDSEFAFFLRSPSSFDWIAEPVGLHGDLFYVHDPRRYQLQPSLQVAPSLGQVARIWSGKARRD